MTENQTRHGTLIPAMDTLIGDPSIIDPYPSSAKQPQKADRLVIPYGFLRRTDDFYNEASTRGDACKDLVHFLSTMRLSLTNAEHNHFILPNGTRIELLNPASEYFVNDMDPRSSRAQAIACARQIKEDVAIWTGSDRQIMMAAAHDIDIAVINQEVYTGRRSVQLSFEDSGMWYSNHRISDNEWRDMFPDQPMLRPNEFVEFEMGEAEFNQKQYSHIGRYDAYEGAIVPLKHVNSMRYGLFPKTAGQAMLNEVLLMPPEEIAIVVVSGVFGTGKTFMTVADGLAQVEKNGKEPDYASVFVCPRDGNLGRQIGYLPGDKYQKIHNAAAPIFDNLSEVLKKKGKDKTSSRYRDKQAKQDENESEKQYWDSVTSRCIQANFEIEALVFMGGRSLTQRYMIYDEAQDHERGQMKALLSRIGDGSKMVVMGDPTQTTNPHLNRTSNGLSYAASKIGKGNEPCAAVITFTEDEIVRSKAAQAIARLFN